MEQLEARRLLTAEMMPVGLGAFEDQGVIPAEISFGARLDNGGAPDLNALASRPGADSPSAARQLPDQAAMRTDLLPSSRWQNAENRFNVSNRPDGRVSPLDALLVLNHVSKFGSGELPVDPTEIVTNFPDVDGDGRATPLDALLVLNHLRTVNQAASVAGNTDLAGVSERAADGLARASVGLERAGERPERPADLPEQAVDRPEQAVDGLERAGDRPERPADLPEQALDRPEQAVDGLERAGERTERPADLPEQVGPSVPDDAADDNWDESLLELSLQLQAFNGDNQ